MAVALLTGLAGQLVPAHGAGAADLAPMAELAADTPVQVIVQAAGDIEAAAQRARELDGTITHDLYIINAFAAKMSLGAAQALATSPSVNWVSLDRPVQSAGGGARYYLVNSDLADTPASPVLGISTTPPDSKVLYNYDTDRDDDPGLLIRRGGGIDSPLAGDLIQEWRLEPFANATSLDDKLEFKVYAALRGFQKDFGRLWLHLLHRDENGNLIAVIGSNSIAKDWDDDWKRETIILENLQYTIPAGHQLGIALTVDAASADDMWVAFDTQDQESHFNAVLLDLMTQTERFYLAPAVMDAPSMAQTTLPFAFYEPTGETLFNYDTDRDDAPGLLIRRGGSGPDESDPAKIQRWRLPMNTGMQLTQDVKFEFHTALENFVKGEGTVHVYLAERDYAGNLAAIIATGSLTKDWDDKWKDASIEFKELSHVLPAGHALELSMTVDATSSADMLFAFGTKDEDSSLEMSLATVHASNMLSIIGARDVWAQGYQGAGIGVAVVDSGISEKSPDFIEEDGTERLIQGVTFNTKEQKDKFGHGTFMAGIIGSNGRSSGGYYKGVAPQVNLINVRVSDHTGKATEANVVAALQWVLENKDAYNIRVVNLSLNSSAATPYHISPMDAAAEVLWFSGVVVVASGGNNGDEDQGVLYPPANDPFIIAVGASDDRGTLNPSDDIVAGFSAYGESLTIPRPDLVAPGTYIVSTLADSSDFDDEYVDHQTYLYKPNGSLVDKAAFYGSGTSAAAAVVSGGVALLLDAMPELNPGQVKWLLTQTATPVDDDGAAAGNLNIAAAFALAQSHPSVEAIPTAPMTFLPSLLLTTGLEGLDLGITWQDLGLTMIDGTPVDWDTINWDSVNWNSVNWNSVNWNSVNWNSVNWNSVNWNSVNWNSVNWNSVNWNSTDWNLPTNSSVDLDY